VKQTYRIAEVDVEAGKRNITVMSGPIVRRIRSWPRVQTSDHQNRDRDRQSAVTALTHNPQPLHLDAEFTKNTEFGQRIVNSIFTLGLMIGCR